MRNLGLRSISSVQFAGASISAVALDLEENAIYVASDHHNADADVKIEIWKIDSDTSSVIEPLKTILVSSFSSNFFPRSSQILSLRVLPDSRALCVILHGGDIVTISLDDNGHAADTVGSVDFGLMAASWSPDESLLALVTGDSKLLLMTSTFDVLSEAPLHTADFGDAAPVNVGWGSKQTQFHGSVGKTAAQAPSASLDRIGSSPDDDQNPRISWRGDGAFFAVSSLSTENTHNARRRRIVRVYDREAALQSTSEPVAGLEHVLSWRPSGNLIASTQRFGFDGGGAGKEGRHDVVFFERNGLRHGEFGLKLVDGTNENSSGYKVKELSWNSGSDVLAVWVEASERDIVQLWITGNYHWYLKQEITSSVTQRFTSVTWHPENGLHLILTTTTEVVQRIYDWETWASSVIPPNDTGSVAVLDSTSILLTSFRSQNVPPPMSSHQLSLSPMPSPSIPIHAAFSSTEDILVLLWESACVQVWDLKTKTGLGRGKLMDPSKVWEGFFDDPLSVSFRRISVASECADKVIITALGSKSTGPDHLVLVDVVAGRIENRREIQLPGRNGNLIEGSLYIWQDSSGQLFNADFAQTSVTHIAKFPAYCTTARHISIPSGLGSLFTGLTQRGNLYVLSPSGACRLITTNANSFTIASGYLVCTTMAHEAQFASISALSLLLDSDDIKEQTWETEKRKVERGSRIITAVPSNMSLVLQMPRGTLESINPRPLVLKVVRQDIDNGDYRKAFLACRKHRIDLNILVEHDTEAFFQRLSSFVEQIDDVDHVNLFLTNIGRSSQPADVISRVCDNVRSELEKKNLTKYINSILTTYVVKTPPNLESGLSLLLHLREIAPSLVGDAVNYIIFLVDADTLFNVALGMYDFSLVLMIAQRAQKDPREYLPFLRELRALDKYYQRFRIDDHLKRHEKALWNLSLAGANRFDEAMDYVEKHRLYEPALSIWKDKDNYNSVLNVYGDWLFEHREFSQAASVFVEAGKQTKAMITYEKALDWQELFDLAIRDNADEEDLISMGLRVAEDLVSKKRYAEAARVILDYTGDVRQAVIALVEGNMFAEARRIVTLHSLPELITEIVHPAAMVSNSQIMEEVGEMKAQLGKQMQRIRELRVRKLEEPDAFYGNEDVDLQNVDIMTDVSMAPTTFTRYTTTPSTMSKKSKQSSRSRRKAERKVGSGRKGTIDEEEYLLHSVTKLVTRLAAVQVEAGKLLPHTLQFTQEHRAHGRSLQQEIIEFQTELRCSIDDIWAKTELPLEDSISTPQRPPNPIDKVPKPEITEPTWRVKLWDVKESPKPIMEA